MAPRYCPGAVPGREHDDGGRSPVPDTADDLEAVEVRELQVEDDEVGWRVRLPPAGPGSRRSSYDSAGDGAPRLYPSMKRTIACIASGVLLLMVSVSVWAAPGDIVSVDNWTEYPVGALLLSVPGTWKVYSSMKVFKYPPTVVLDDARRALRLKTDHETMAIGRSFHLDVATTRTLMWEWKPLVLPVGGDVREHAAKRNDQAARVVLWFDASLFTERRAIGYIWDSSAPVGTIIRQSSGAVERALVVVRSGPSGLGAWHRETRDVYQDYRDIFGDEPAQLVAVTLESHSDDVASESAVLFRRVRFQAR